jgi:hypothetical protein
MINARSETAASKPAFGDALKFRRCLIPVVKEAMLHQRTKLLPERVLSVPCVSVKVGGTYGGFVWA